MKNIEDINREAVKKIVSNKKITKFFPGDTIKVGVKIVEGKRERIQGFFFLKEFLLRYFGLFLLLFSF